MVRKERQRSSSPQLARFSNDSPQLKQASTPLYRTRQRRYTIPHICGHRQVVRHQLPKLTLAGSSPVARSIRISGTVTFRYRAFFNKVPGLEPARVRALSEREAFVASRRRRLKPVRICEANTRMSPWLLLRQNVRLMPAAHTCTCARYNGWVTTNVPITKKEPL